MDGFVWFLLGALVSVPISVFAPFLTQKYQQYRGTRNQHQARLRTRQLQAEFEQAQKMNEDAGLFASFLVGRILILTIVAAIGGLLSGLLYAAATTLYQLNYCTGTVDLATPAGWINVSGGLVGVLVTVLTIQIGLRTLRVRACYCLRLIQSGSRN